MRRPALWLSSCAMLVCFAIPRPASAAWPSNPGANLPVATPAGGISTFPVAAPDAAGGAFVTWSDSRTGSTDVYVQHVTASGVPDSRWPAGGLDVSPVVGNQFANSIIPDGAGGAVVAWSDPRNGNLDVYLQHVLVNGTVDPSWPANGLALCTASGDQESPVLASDGAGGAIAAWMDSRNGNWDIYAQHARADGTPDPNWPVNGLPLCTAAGEQSSAAITPDGAGGAIVTWQDRRNGTDFDIYAQRAAPNGTLSSGWPFNGAALCVTSGDQNGPAIVGDGAGGAIVTWSDYRSGTGWDVYAQHVQATSALDINWGSTGRGVATGVSDQLYPNAIPDGAGGEIVTWMDFRSGTYHPYAQHVLGDGAMDVAWPPLGLQLCSAPSGQFNPTIAPDGAGGAIVTWYDDRNALNSDIYAQHVPAGGSLDPNWPVDGRAVSTASGDQQYPMVVTDGAGGAIAVWYDNRSGQGAVYAQRVARFGYLGTPEAEFIGVSDVPNDNGGKVKVSWYASYLDLDSDPNLNYYEIYRSAAPNLVAQAKVAGATVATSFARAPRPDACAYYVQPAGDQVYAWEYLGQQTAAHYLSAYSFLASTATDSTGAYNPPTAFMIVARNYSGDHYWLSQPDSGYSVDNLAPVAPAPFSGQYGGGVAHLHWDPNTESDLAGYRLYRGTTTGFVPGPGNEVAALTDTGYADPSGAVYVYKLSAVDIHGNESPYSTLNLFGTTDVGGPATPREAFLARPTPNPSRGTTLVRFGLPREAYVSLAVYDAGGREVRRLASGTLEAGEHSASWDLADDAGRAAPAGLYFVRLEVSGLTLVQRLATIR